ncbi:MAG: hypothetical protein PHX83_08325 [Acidobacteriia bacterium]|nr:hypothetical protein [Terriglobia bacterium]
MTPSESLPVEWSRFQRGALLAAIVAFVTCAFAGGRNPDQFFRSYLFAYLFWIGIAIGSAEVVMLQHLVGGQWGLALRRPLESGARTLWLMAILFVPLVFGVRHLYLWAQPQALAQSEELRRQSFYLNMPFFFVRVAFYFAIWLLFTYLLTKWSQDQDRQADPALGTKFQVLSGPGLVLFGLTVTFASVDWVMSLEPRWTSTIYGLIFIVGQVLSTLAFMIIVVMLLSRRKPLSDLLSAKVRLDLGNLMLTFVILWAYMAVSQLIIIWSGNLQDEIPWYLRRTAGMWGNVAIFLALFHFFIPFLLLLSRDVKRRGWLLGAVAGMILFVNLVDTFWLVEPGLLRNGFRIHALDLATVIGVGGLWVAFFIRCLKQYPLVPPNDPRWAESLIRAGHD